MSWTLGYLPGSFRGVEFRTETSRVSGGRRLVEHTFPERDDSAYEDQGKKNRTFTMGLYVIGDDYYDQRNDLIKAFDEEGVGPLIHPYYGSILVYVTDWDETEVRPEGRIARFNVTFKQFFEVFLAVAIENPLDKLQEAKGDFLTAALEALVAVYDVVTGPLEYLQDAINVGNQVLDIVDQAKKITGAYEEYQAKLDAMKGQFTELVLQARAMGEDFIDLIDFGADTTNPVTFAISAGDDAKTQYSELKAVTGIQDSTLTKYPSLAEDIFPSFLIQKFVSRVGLASRAGLVGTMTLTNANQGDEIIKEIGELVQTIESEVGVDDELYATARDLRVAVVEVLRDRQLTLESLKEIKLPDFEPSLVISWQQYKTIEREQEIIDLNRVLDPGFFAAGVPLLVTDDE